MSRALRNKKYFTIPLVFSILLTYYSRNFHWFFFQFFRDNREKESDNNFEFQILNSKPRPYYICLLCINYKP